jgi:hypothetical protein
MSTLTNSQKAVIKSIVSNISTIKGNKFVGLRYESKGSTELADYTVNCGFSYEAARNKDVERLEQVTNEILRGISVSENVPFDLLVTAKDKLLAAFLKNMNKDKEKRSEQSKAQELAYLPIAKSLKLCIATGKIHLYALKVRKNSIEAGIEKIDTRRPLTIAQDKLKKALNFSTRNFRNFIVTPENLYKCSSTGLTFEM